MKVFKVTEVIEQIYVVTMSDNELESYQYELEILVKNRMEKSSLIQKKTIKTEIKELV